MLKRDRRHELVFCVRGLLWLPAVDHFRGGRRLPILGRVSEVGYRL